MLKTRDGAARAPLKGDGEGMAAKAWRRRHGGEGMAAKAWRRRATVCVAAKGNADEQQRGAARGARRGGFGKRDGFGKRGGEGSL